MTASELLAWQFDWAAKNLAHNLDFFPGDKVNWKPEPTANSALEVANHAMSGAHLIHHVLTGGKAEDDDFVPAKTTEEAQKLLTDFAEVYSKMLREIKEADYNNPVSLPFGDTTLLKGAALAITEMLNHHGQVTYIQTLLGDTVSHFHG